MSTSIKNLVEFYNIDNYKNELLIKQINHFCKFYKQFENVVSKPVYNQKYNKYYSTNKSFKSMNPNKKTIFENDTVWENYKPTNDNKNIRRIINNNLNKISNDNFEIVCKELIDEIKKIDNFNLIEILNNEIYEKMIFDIKFQELYYSILKKIWEININPNITIIIQENDKYFWKRKTTDIEKEELFGPFESKVDAYNNINKSINLRKYFISKLNREFKCKQSYYEKIDEESDGDTKHKLKRKCFGPIEIIQKLYKDKYINQIIICNIIDSLIKCNSPYAIESVNILLKYCNTNIKSDLPTNKILKEYRDRIVALQPEYSKNFKIKFLLMDILKYIDNLMKSNTKNNIYVPVKKTQTYITKIKNMDNYLKKNIFKHNSGNIARIFSNSQYNKTNLIKILVNNAVRYNNHANFVYGILRNNFEKNIIKKQHFREVFKIIETTSSLSNNYYVFKKSCTKLYYHP
jgi:hypothetical protein